MEEITRRSNVLKLGCILAVFAGVMYAQKGTSHGQTVSVTDSRPLAQIAEILNGRYGVPISYEDASAYPFDGDLGDTVETERRRGFPSAPALTLRNTTLKFVAEPLDVGFDGAWPGRPADPAGVARILQGVLDQHAANGSPGRFKILQTKLGLAIVPTATRNSAGDFVPEQSLLDTRISFAKVEGDTYSVINTFTEALAAASGAKIDFPFGGLAHSSPVAANNEIARDVLARIATGLVFYRAGPPLPLVWTLVTQPGIAPPHTATYRMDLRMGTLDFAYSANDTYGAVPIPRPAPPRPNGRFQ